MVADGLLIHISPLMVRTRWYVGFGSGNDLVPSSINPLPEPMLTRFYDGQGISRHGIDLVCLNYSGSGSILITVKPLI